MLSAVEHRKLQSILDRATHTINVSKVAWAADAFDSDHAEKLVHARALIAQELARYEDGPRYRANLCWHTLDAMRDYVIAADGLLEAFDAIVRPGRSEEWIRSPTGQWAGSRRVLINNSAFEYAVVCMNPAVGRVELDEWEDSVRENLEMGMAA